MTVSIKYKTNLTKKSKFNDVLFVNEKFNLDNIKRYFLSSEFSVISNIIKTKDLKNQIIDFDIVPGKKIILASINRNITSYEAEDLGAKFYNKFKDAKINEFLINTETINAISKLKNLVGHFIHGIKLKSYSFDKYKSKL